MKKLLLVSMMLIAPALAHAGAQANDTANCASKPDGSGYCVGTIAGFRNSATDTDFAGFQVSTINRFFQANFAGKSYFCISNNDTGSMNQQGWVAASATKRFYVEWDKNGTCIDVATYNYSYNR